MRILHKNIAGHLGKTVTVQGWLHKKRLLGGLNFITLRDRSGLVQILAENKDELEKLRGLQVGTVMTVSGSVVKDERAPGGAEVHDPSFTIISPVTDEPPIEIDKPLNHKSENLDTLFENRPIGLRNLQEAAVFKIQAQVSKSLRTYFDEHEFTEIRSPKLLAEPTEGGAEVFAMDYFGKTATLAQSPQFYKQMMVGVFERVYEIAPVYRAEPSATSRHMTEYISVDAEMGFIEIEDLEVFLSGLVNRVVDDAWAAYEPELKRWNASKPKLVERFPTIPMEEIHELYSKATGEGSRGEKDMRPDEERWICEYAKKKFGCEAVFVSKWPAAEMKFYHKRNEQEPVFADRLDLLFRGVEVATISMRENNYEVVVKQLQDLADGDPNDPGFKPLLSAMRYGMPPHGGFGLGLERLTQKIIGLGNIKEASLFPRDINRLAP